MPNAALKHAAKLVLRPAYRAGAATAALRAREIRRIRRMPRYKGFESNLLGVNVEATDSISFLNMYVEIFEREIYRFERKKSGIRPYILDCGANIGVSVIYLKRAYPDSEIVAFEADPQIYKVLTDNLNRNNLLDVRAINKAVWDSDGTLEFWAEGGEAGRVARQDNTERTIKVDSVRLASFLDRRVDFLKIDIEGAETCVLRDCRDELKRVENIFVEYHSFASEPQTIAELCQMLLDAGFRLSIQPVMKESVPSPMCQTHFAQGMDFQLNIFGYRRA